MLVALAIALNVLLVVVMVAMTRYLRAHPDDTLRGQGSGSWSDGLADTSAAGAADAPVPGAGATTAPTAQDETPLDDMPAEVVAEVARRIGQRRD